MTYMAMTLEDIIAWCKENNQVEWLKAKSKEEVEFEMYPKKKVVNEAGRKVAIADKSQPKVKVKQRITFVQLKYDFCEKFMPEILPKSTKPKKQSMYDVIEAL